jgi:hypothetical protein
MIVQLPVSVAFGSDDEFDLRVRLERELTDALAEHGSGRCAGGEIDTSHMKLVLDDILDAAAVLDAVKTVLARVGVLGRAIVVQETRATSDPDDRDWHVLWPPNYSGVVNVA